MSQKTFSYTCDRMQSQTEMERHHHDFERIFLPRKSYLNYN